MLKELNSDKRIGIVSPVQLTGKGDHLDPNFSQYISKSNLPDLKNDLVNGRIEAVEFVNAAAWFIPVPLVKKIGGFDPLFPHYGEDRDYCNRVIFHRYFIHVVLDSFIHHDREYAAENPYRKIYNLTLTMGLAHVKNINKQLIRNYLSWLIWRSRKIIKAIINLDTHIIQVELKVIVDLLRLHSEILSSRTKSKTSKGPFLE